MDKNHRLGRTGAGARALERAHARRLLLTLAKVVRQLELVEVRPAARGAYHTVEAGLLAWRKKLSRPVRRTRGGFRS